MLEEIIKEVPTVDAYWEAAIIETLNNFSGPKKKGITQEMDNRYFYKQKYVDKLLMLIEEVKLDDKVKFKMVQNDDCKYWVFSRMEVNE